MDDALPRTLSAVVAVLEAERIEYAITGSVARSIYGQRHTTINVNIVLRMTAEQAQRVADALPRRCCCPGDMLVEAAHSGGMARLIDADTGLKVDLSVLPAGAFHDHVLKRRRRVPFGREGRPFAVASAEDVILMKLLWRRDTDSQQHWDDAPGVVRVQGARLDRAYLFDQAKCLGVVDQLVALRNEGGV